MADTIIYRVPLEEDYPRIEEIIGKSFNLQRYLENKEITGALQHMYIQEPKAVSGFQCVAVEDGEVTGVIMASSHNDVPERPKENIEEQEKALAEMVRKEPGLLKSKGLMEQYNAFIESQLDQFDGSLTLFAVTDACRGKGVGKTLLEKAREYWKEHGAKRIYLYTDETCSTGFYDHLGFECLNAQQFTFPIDGKEQSMGVFFYGYTV